MDARDEIERIAISNYLTSMPANPWEFDIELGFGANDKIKEVLYALRAIANKSPALWPSDLEWRASLPDWLNKHLSELTKEEADRILEKTPRDRWDRLPWEFGSWIDAIRDRGWKWWGYKQEGSRATFVVHISMLPERVDAFREILRAADTTILSERYRGLKRE